MRKTQNLNLRLTVGPGSKYVYFIYLNKDHVGALGGILSVHQRVWSHFGQAVPKLVWTILGTFDAEGSPLDSDGDSLRNSLVDALELGKPLDPATSRLLVLSSRN